MLTGQDPYAECQKAHHLFRKVSNRSPPDALALVQDKAACDLIESCLRKMDQRPSAAELLHHPFLQVRAVSVATAAVKSRNGCQVTLSFTIAHGSNKHKEIVFVFDTKQDTSTAIATEMVDNVPTLAKGGPALKEEIQAHIDRLVAESQ
eukprot:TRINITY_DN3073_c0_g2_i3.p1 TRINITY_DN3073_c0_g2~~TRINITY_DN3073_c0_g2_i3.p1  ORF type:complete len:149 (-),score=35.13 TRINITY_DN3073_c0_g2_i3:176-622(-)